MTTMRAIGMLVLASALTKIGGLGMTWQASADAAPPRAPAMRAEVTDLACGSDGRGFRELLETVRARAAELERRESELRARESGLVAARRIVTGEVSRLEAVAKTLGIVGTPGPGVSIAKVYEAMPAEDAAPILDRLDDATLRTVLGRMRERQVGAILAAMSRERAASVTKVFAAPLGTPRTPSR